MSGALVKASTNIEIGNHVEGHFLGMTFNLDTIWTTLVAGGIVLILAFWARSALTKSTSDHVPTKIQLVWETIVGEVNTQVEANLGKVNPFVVPLAVALFFFILIANWIEVIPTKLNSGVHLLPSPTADTNLTYAMALMAMVGAWIYGIRQRGLKGFLKHFLEPFPVMLPLNILEELTKPVTLALRLFGNIFAGGIMLALFGLIPAYASWFPNVIWKLFDTMFLGGIQAFIFALLTVLYFGMAGARHGDEHEDDHAKEQPKDEPDRSEQEQSPALAS
ncbi:MAG: F0F1 ATP synthase subunit A [Actinomycetota bacterium]|nr:F0F1 ATP synthase subunit A [Actinomycetota bacterium]